MSLPLEYFHRIQISEKELFNNFILNLRTHTSYLNDILEKKCSDIDTKASTKHAMFLGLPVFKIM